MDDAHPIRAAVREDVLARLAAAAREHDVRVLHAVESGSRAWGFASPGSDFDARLIYVHRRDCYLAVGLQEQRDVIEYPIVDEVDIDGWDLRKALRLFCRSNPASVEWLRSPILCAARGSFTARARCCRRSTRASAASTTGAAWRRRTDAASGAASSCR